MQARWPRIFKTAHAQYGLLFFWSARGDIRVLRGLPGKFKRAEKKPRILGSLAAMSDEVQRTRECIRARLFSTNPALDHEVESDVLSNESTPQSRRTAYRYTASACLERMVLG